MEPARIRAWNPLIRSHMPYPSAHGTKQISVKCPKAAEKRLMDNISTVTQS